MRLTYLLAFFLFFGFNAALWAQNVQDDILFSVDGEAVYVSEFMRVYNKNLDLVKDESQKDVDAYLDLFVNYKLKLKEARTLEFDKKPQYIREFNSYKKQLAKNYLTDTKVTEALVKEAYDRISYDVKVKHILVRFAETEDDTTAVYKQMLTFKDRLENEDFEAIQKDVHNGNTVFAEDLGYFSGFKMVYAFETVAYNTPVGEVSDPFRTQFGYHVLKVYDKRKSRGEVTVGHIMITNKQKDTTANPEERIREIYKLIQQGEEFESLAKRFSEDQSSAKKGGKLTPFKSGQLTSVTFEDKAFSLKETGEISEPFKTDYGWHISKLYEKKDIEPFEVMKSRLETRVKRDSRSKVINEAFINKLKKQYGVSARPNLDYFVSILNNSYFQRSWTIPSDLPQDKPLVKIGDRQLTYFHFAEFLGNAQKRISRKMDFDDLTDMQYDAFINDRILKYHEENLENVNEEYAQILSEYRDGLLLFDLMETKIWNAVKQDTVGLQTYFNNNRASYKWPRRVEAVIMTSSEKEFADKARKALNQNLDVEKIKTQLNSDNKQHVIVTSGLMTEDHPLLPKGFQFNTGVSNVYEHNNAYHVIKVAEVLPVTEKTFEEAKGMVISDYQTVVENEWLQTLKNKYKVIVDQGVLEKVKTKIKR